MKIITSDAAYVQMNDMLYLNSSHMPIPDSIFMKVFGQGITIIDNSNRYDFICFDDEKEIDYFRGLDWIVDYDSVKDLEKDEFMDGMQSVAKEHAQIASTYNAMTVLEKLDHDDMMVRCNLLEYKYLSLRDFWRFKQGRLKMLLPEGVDYPEGMNREKGIKRFFKKKKNDKKGQ